MAEEVGRKGIGYNVVYPRGNGLANGQRSNAIINGCGVNCDRTSIVRSDNVDFFNVISSRKHIHRRKQIVHSLSKQWAAKMPTERSGWPSWQSVI